MSIVGPLRKFSADVLDSNVQKIFNFKGFSLCLCLAKIFYFILFKLANRAIRVRYNADFTE